MFTLQTGLVTKRLQLSRPWTDPFVRREGNGCASTVLHWQIKKKNTDSFNEEYINKRNSQP